MNRLHRQPSHSRYDDHQLAGIFPSATKGVVPQTPTTGATLSPFSRNLQRIEWDRGDHDPSGCSQRQLHLSIFQYFWFRSDVGFGVIQTAANKPQ